MSDRFSRAMATRDAVRAEPRAVPKLPPITEKAWLAQVVELAQLRGWKTYHTQNSMHSAAGFPDLVLCRPPQLIFAELKTDRKGSYATAEQAAWLKALRECGDDFAGVGVFLWRPSDFETVKEVLW